MNWILHIDMNSFFASVEQQYNPALRGKAIGVGGKPGTRSVIVAPSREAKRLGVRVGMNGREAFKHCPQLIIVPPVYERYQAISQHIFQILEQFSPAVEPFSIDEGFIEIDTSLEQAINIARTIKTKFHNQLGPVLTASIGIARNKRLAKLASESQKPDGLVALLNNAEEKTVAKLRREGVTAWTQVELFTQTQVEELCGIGPRLGRRLRAAGIQTLADLTQQSLDTLRTLVFPYEKELHLIGQGIDLARVVPYWRQKAEQSIGHQYTLPHDVPVRELRPILFRLSEKVGNRLRKRGFVGQSIQIYLRRTNAPSWGSTLQTSYRIESDRDIECYAWKLISSACQRGDKLTLETLVRMPSVTVSVLTPKIQAPVRLPFDANSSNLTMAINKIRARFGETSVQSGWSVGVKMHNLLDGRSRRLLCG